MKPSRAKLPQRTLVFGTAAILACGLIAAVAWSLAERDGGPNAAKPFWLVVASTRDGSPNEGYGAEPRAYSVRPDGSRLTRVLAKDRELDPIGVSANGSTIAYGAGEYPHSLYVSRADGTALRRVVHVGQSRTFESAALSPDGRELALTTRDPNEHPRILVVGADGRHLWDGPGADPDWSRDGRKVVFATGRGCAVAVEPFDREPVHVRGLCGVPKWAPDGNTFVFETKGGCEVVRSPVQSDWLERLTGKVPSDGGVFIRGRCQSPEWSPDGRWIAFATTGCPYCESEKAMRAAREKVGMWVIRPNGEDRRRIGPAEEETGAVYSWSPDGKLLAFTEASRIFVARVPGRAKRLRLAIEPSYDSESAPMWSPNGMELMLAGQEGEDPSQIWTFRPDGHGLRRLTSEGENDLVGEAVLAPTRAPETPLPWSERVLGPKNLETRRPIGMLAGDGGRVAYAAGTTRTDCEHVSIWTPAMRSIIRSRLPTPCEDEAPSVYELALAGSVVGWSTLNGCSPSNCEVVADMAALPRLRPLLVGEDDSSDGSDEGGQLTRFGFSGHSNVFVFDDTVRVDTGAGGIRRCKLHRNGSVRSVDGHLLAVHERAAVAVLDDRCTLVKVFPFARGEVKRTLLDGRHLVVSRLGSVETYDVDTGRLVVGRALQAGYKLSDVAGGIALLLRGRTILLLRLADRRTITFTPCRGPVRADIEKVGLYYSYATVDRGGRLVFVPRSELERRLSSGANFKPRCLRSAYEYKTGPGPSSIAVGDLNRDGRPDLVTTNEASRGSVSVLLNGGDGTFPTKRVYRTGGIPSALVIGDLDGDGKLDVVTANGYANAISVLLNRGDGTFAASRRYPVGKNASAVAIGDFDDDGSPDLAVVDEGDNAVSVLLNSGDGSFGPKVDYAAGKYPSGFAIADVGRDGIPDLLIAHTDTSNAISVLAGTGDGTFGRARSYATGASSNEPGLAIGDLNQDGRPDVVTAAGCGVSAFLGRVRGSAKPRGLARPEDCVRHFALGDLDGDRRADLVVAGYSYPFPATVSVFLNRSRGGFEAAGNYEAAPPGGVQGLAIADLNGDGRPDLAATAGAVSVLINTLGVCRVRHFEEKTRAAAAATLARSHCRLGRIRRAFSKKVEKGHVIRPEPRFGAFWPDGPEVDLVLSLGPKR